MQPTLEEMKQQAHALIDFLPKEKLVAVHDLLAVMVDPLHRSLALAPVDDEVLTPEAYAAIEQGRASIARGEGISHAEMLREFGLESEAHLAGLQGLKKLPREIWDGVDADEYVSDLRKDWE